MPGGEGGTADWRVRLADGHISDIEVTTNTRGEARAFMAAASGTKGEPRVWPARSLSYNWTFRVFDHEPGESRQVRTVKELVGLLERELREIESLGGTPSELLRRAEHALARSPVFSAPQYADPRHIPRDVRLSAMCQGGHAQQICTTGDPPEHRGARLGAIETVWALVAASAGHEALIRDLRHCIARKAAKRQLEHARGEKWLAVVLDGLARDQLCAIARPEWAESPPSIDDISFDEFDDVWAIAEDGARYVVLRLTAQGSTQAVRAVARHMVGN